MKIYISWEDYHKDGPISQKIHEDNLKFNQIICIAKVLRLGDVLVDFNISSNLICRVLPDSDDIKNQQGQFTFSRDLQKHPI